MDHVRARRHPPVLMYHGVGDRAREQDLNDLFVPVGTFDRHLRILRRSFRPMTLTQFLDAYDAGSWPRGSVLVTIDDGFSCVSTEAAPRMAAYDVPGVVFLPPAALGGTADWTTSLSGEPIITAEQARALPSYGLEVGVHGMGHARMVGMGQEELRTETADARARLREIMGADPVTLAYPWGDFDDAAVDAVRSAGFRAAFSVERSGDRFTLRRRNVNSFDSDLVFRLKAGRAWDDALRLKNNQPTARLAASAFAGRSRRKAVKAVARAGESSRGGVGSEAAAPAHTPGPTVEFHRGRDRVAGLAPEIDRLTRSAGCPVTARQPWMQAWSDTFTSYEPFAVTVSRDGELVGLALLASRRRWGLTQVVAVGHGPSDDIRLPVLVPGDASVLAGAVVEEIRRLPSPWRLVLDQLPPGDAVAREVLWRLPHADLHHGDASPVTRFGWDREPASYLSRRGRKKLGGRRRALARRAGEVSTQDVRDPAEIARLLPELERLCRAREQLAGRRSQIDHPETGPFYRRMVQDHACVGEVSLTTLRVSGVLVAYSLCLVDGAALRKWNGGFEPEFAQAGVGHMVDDAAVLAALADDAVDTFDWMRGVEPYKLRYANDVVASQRLTAWSGGGLTTAERSARRVRAILRRLGRQWQLRTCRPDAPQGLSGRPVQR